MVKLVLVLVLVLMALALVGQSMAAPVPGLSGSANDHLEAANVQPMVVTDPFDGIAYPISTFSEDLTSGIPVLGDIPIGATITF